MQPTLTEINLTEKRIKYFWSKVDIKGSDECWPWKGYRSSYGYGIIQFDHSNYSAHRVSFYLKHGHFPKHGGCHSCDNPPCCNPAHIFDGSQYRNVKDAFSKGRMTNKHALKLSMLQVEEIRRQYKQGLSQYQLAEKFKVNQSTICRIVNNIRRMTSA